MPPDCITLGEGFNFYNFFTPAAAPSISVSRSSVNSAAIEAAGSISPSTARNVSLGAAGLAFVLIASVFAGKGPAPGSPAAMPAAEAAKKTETALQRARAGIIPENRPWY